MPEHEFRESSIDGLISETGDSNRFKQTPLEMISSISNYFNFDSDLKPDIFKQNTSNR